MTFHFALPALEELMRRDTFATICAHVQVSVAKECSQQLVMLDEVQLIVQELVKRAGVRSRPQEMQNARLFDLLGRMKSAALVNGENLDALMRENLDLRRQLTESES